MQINNIYRLRGVQCDISIGTVKKLSVQFADRLVEYDVTELEELLHDYVATIHKATEESYIYRRFKDKKILVLVGTKKTLAYAVSNVTLTIFILCGSLKTCYQFC